MLIGKLVTASLAEAVSVTVATKVSVILPFWFGAGVKVRFDKSQPLTSTLVPSLVAVFTPSVNTAPFAEPDISNVEVSEPSVSARVLLIFSTKSVSSVPRRSVSTSIAAFLPERAISEMLSRL